MRALVLVLVLVAPVAAAQAPDLQAPGELRLVVGASSSYEVFVRHTGDTARELEVALESPWLVSAPERLLLEPGTSARVTLAAAAVAGAPTDFDAQVVARASGGADRLATAFLVRVTVDPAPVDVGPSAAGAVALGALVAFGGLAWVSPRARHLLVLPLAALYTRIRPSTVLAHPTRRRILDVLSAGPITHAQLRRATDLPVGSLEHHLRILRMHRLVIDARLDASRVIAPVHVPLPARAPLTPAQARVLAALAPGALTQAEVAARVGLTRQGAGWQLRRLEARGAAVRQLVDGEWRWRAAA